MSMCLGVWATNKPHTGCQQILCPLEQLVQIFQANFVIINNIQGIKKKKAHGCPSHPFCWMAALFVLRRLTLELSRSTWSEVVASWVFIASNSCFNKHFCLFFEKKLYNTIYTLFIIVYHCLSLFDLSRSVIYFASGPPSERLSDREHRRTDSKVLAASNQGAFEMKCQDIFSGCKLKIWFLNVLNVESPPRMLTWNCFPHHLFLVRPTNLCVQASNWEHKQTVFLLSTKSRSDLSELWVT